MDFTVYEKLVNFSLQSWLKILDANIFFIHPEFIYLLCYLLVTDIIHISLKDF